MISMVLTLMGSISVSLTYTINSLALRCCFLLTFGYAYLLSNCDKKVSVTLEDANLGPSYTICMRDMDNAIGYYQSKYGATHDGFGSI